MNKIKQNKITFLLILIAIVITFSSLTILSLPVLFNYESKVPKIEKNFYNNFKIFLKTSGNISYKPFPKPHLLVENASLNLKSTNNSSDLINTSNLKIFISLQDIYLRLFKNFNSAEISNSNLEFKISDIVDLRNHLYKNINKPISIKNCKLFIKNTDDDVILISQIKKVIYKINSKAKIKKLLIDGKIFGIDFKSDWERNYKYPNKSVHDIKLFNPNIEIKNIFNFQTDKQFGGKVNIEYFQDKLEYNYEFSNNKIKIISPNEKNTNFKVFSNIQLDPFYFNGSITIKNKKVEKIIDIILLNLLEYEENYLGNISGIFKIKFSDLNNKLIQNGEIDIEINEKSISFNNSVFYLNKIGTLQTNIKFIDREGETVFYSENELNIENHIEFAKIFQIGSKKIKNINKIFFDLQKNIGETDFTISNVRINVSDNFKKPGQEFVVKNIQNLRANFREVID